eukprot:1810062-Amphidinium_carterae.1
MQPQQIKVKEAHMPKSATSFVISQRIEHSLSSDLDLSLQLCNCCTHFLDLYRLRTSGSKPAVVAAPSVPYNACKTSMSQSVKRNRHIYCSKSI